ncbi:MAG: hypothetical protein M0P69_21820 [Bacteroidales bacterium]|jgi:hypothetical protein|nr:hypothetical protein [Bacteroidales bacterium]
MTDAQEKQIRKIISDYHYALDQSFQGELATIAMVQIEAVLGMNYREGIERTERRRG